MKLRKYSKFFSLREKDRIRRYEASLKLTVPAVESKAVAPLSPALGQYGLSCTDFCEQFNDETGDLASGLPLRVQLVASLHEREFKYYILGVSFVHLIRCVSDNTVNLLAIYKYFLCLRFLQGSSFKSEEIQDICILQSLFGILQSMHIKILLYY